MKDAFELICSMCGFDNKNTKLSWHNQLNGNAERCSVISLACAGCLKKFDRTNKLICYGVWEHVNNQKEANEALPNHIRIF